MEDHHFKVRDRRIGPGSPQADQGPSLVNPTGHGGHPNDKPSMVYKMSQIEISVVSIRIIWLFSSMDKPIDAQRKEKNLAVGWK